MTDYWVFQAIGSENNLRFCNERKFSQMEMERMSSEMADAIEQYVVSHFERRFRITPDEAYWQVDTLRV